jgi:DNA-binding response OmpR family regulator
MSHLPESVLIVEDEILPQQQMREILESMGIPYISEANDPDTAKAILKKHPCDFILMDINLDDPRMDGISLAREILLERTIPIVFVTAYDDSTTFEETLDLTPYGFLAKPFVEQDLERVVKIAYARFEKYRNEEKAKHDTEVVSLANGYVYHTNLRMLTHQNKRIVLRGRMALFVELLCKNPHTIVSYESLIDHIWKGEASLSSLRTLVYDLRKAYPDFPLVTHSKIGYSVFKD